MHQISDLMKKPQMLQITSWQDGGPMTFYFSKLRSLRDPEGMPPVVKEAQQWQFCDACGRKPLELVEIAVCLLLWYCCMPTRPRVLTIMARAQECWVREGGNFQPLSHPRTSTFFSPRRSYGSTMFPNPSSSRFVFPYRSRHLRLFTTEQELVIEGVAVGLMLYWLAKPRRGTDRPLAANACKLEINHIIVTKGW